MPCLECLKPCELHSVLYCPTCHKHEGECEFGDCEDDHTHKVVHPQEVRKFCTKHATHPHFQYARTGCEVTELPHADH